MTDTLSDCSRIKLHTSPTVPQCVRAHSRVQHSQDAQALRGHRAPGTNQGLRQLAYVCERGKLVLLPVVFMSCLPTIYNEELRANLFSVFVSDDILFASSKRSTHIPTAGVCAPGVQNASNDKCAPLAGAQTMMQTHTHEHKHAITRA